MAKKLRVAVLMGGKSPEHDISLLTGKEVARNLDPKKYKVTSIVISQDGKSFSLNNKKRPLSQLLVVNCHPSTSLRIDPELNRMGQLFFIAMHGPFGEDGTIQGLLEFAGIPYTGSRVLASALGMDKLYSRKLFIQAGLTTPEYIVIEKNDNPNIVWEKFKPPVFVHPHNQGSAVGSSLVRVKSQLKRALALAHKYSEIALVDEYIHGVEVSCAILGNQKLRALPLVEIVPKREFFDWKAKYNPKFCDEIVPARVNEKLTKKCQEAAKKAYQAIGCQNFGRVDMIIKGSKIYVLEVNTIPGLTPVSLFPKAAKAAGISYTNLLDDIIDLSLQEINP